MPYQAREYWYKADGSVVDSSDAARGYIAFPYGSQVPAAKVPVAYVPAAPTLTTLTPSTAAIASSGLKVTLTGTGFSGNCVVTAGGVVMDGAAFISATSMQANIRGAAAGAVPVVVRDDYGQVSAAVNFTFS
jgi:hypothetical protein